MRDVVQEILHGISGQSLILDVPEGRPSSVTSCTVLETTDDDDGPVESAVGAPAVETNPDTTSTAAAGTDETDATTIALTLATNVTAGRSYLFASAGGDSEWVEPVGLSGLNVRLRHPLLNQYAAGSTFKGTRITAVIDATWVADEANLSSEEDIEPRYRVAWVYTVGGVVKRRQTSFDLVRYSAQHHVTPLDVDNGFPGWIDRLPTDYRREQGRPLIEQAWRSVKMDLRADRKLARWVRNLDVVTELVIARANLAAIEHSAMRGVVQPAALEAAQKIYRQRYDQLIREPHTQLAAQPMGGRVEARRAPLFSR